VWSTTCRYSLGMVFNQYLVNRNFNYIVGVRKEQMKLLHGMKVTCEIDGTKITDAKISKNVNGRFYICQNKLSGAETKDKLGYSGSWGISEGNLDDLKYHKVTNLKIIGKTKDISDISTYMIGDILVDEYGGHKRKVLGICGLAILLSLRDRFEATAGLYTTQEVVNLRFSFEEPKDTLIGKELTKTTKGKRYKVVVKEEIK